MPQVTVTRAATPGTVAQYRLGLRWLSALLPMLAATLLLGCASPNRTAAPMGDVRADCGGAGGSAAGSPAGEEADFALHGFPRVAVSQRFTPGVESSISASAITLVMPADMYTEPLDFELLVGEEMAWVPCVEDKLAVVAPYAYRVTEPTTGKRIGRFDKPVSVSISDPRIVEGAAYWLTSADHPPTVQESSNKPEVVGSVLRVTNGGARAGWFVTVRQN